MKENLFSMCIFMYPVISIIKDNYKNNDELLIKLLEKLVKKIKKEN